MIGSLLLKPFFAEPLLRIWRNFRLRDRVVVLMYHEVLEDSSPSVAWTAVRESEFIKQLTYLRKHFSVITLSEALSITKRQSFTTTPDVVITFDDGYSGNRRIVLPIIERLKIPITVFVATKAIQDQQPYWYDMIINRFDSAPTDTVHLDLNAFGLGLRVFEKGLTGERRWDRIQQLLSDLKLKLPGVREEIVESILGQTALLSVDYKPPFRPMTIEDIGELAASEFVTIGAHSHCHNILTQLEPSAAKKTIITSKKLLESWTGQQIDFFAYPNGDFNTDTISAITQAGFVSAFTTQQNPWSNADFIFTVPRVGIGRFDSMTTFKLKVSGFPV